MLRAGVAGVGNLGKLHVGGLLSMADLVSVDALADPVEEKRSGKNLKTKGLNLQLGADEAATTGNIRSYDDYKPLCKDKALDVVVIATPSDLHAKAAILALEHGKHVFTEKPMALNYKDCGRMIDAAKANKRTLMVGHCLRFYPEYVAAYEIMQSGRYGKVLTANMNRHGGRPGGWFAETKRSGGVNLDLHIHDIDTALWWWGRPDKRMSHTFDAQPGASSVLSQWHYSAGPEVQMEASWDAGSGFAGEFRIVLEKATLVYEAGKLNVIMKGSNETVDLSGRPGGHRAEMIYFIQSLKERKPVTRCLPEDSAMAVQFAKEDN
jgi:predicted dehydrogenase